MGKTYEAKVVIFDKFIKSTLAEFHGSRTKIMEEISEALKNAGEFNNIQIVITEEK